MVFSFFGITINRSTYIVSSNDIVVLLKYAGWSISDLRGRGRLRDVNAWLTAIAIEYRKAVKAANKSV